MSLVGGSGGGGLTVPVNLLTEVILECAQPEVTVVPGFVEHRFCVL
jgi:hypothetical protein